MSRRGLRHAWRWPWLLVVLVLAGLPAGALAVRLQHGDLLFVSATDTGLSGAIADATGGQAVASFDHVALLDLHAGTGGRVLHADPLGSREQALAGFLANARRQQRQVWVYRLQAIAPEVIDTAIGQARRMLGKPYNHSYVPDEDSYYCSDFIERAFRAHRVFALQPMNFRNPHTGQIAPYWTDFYRGLGIAVPQGLPGTNPNDMAAADALAPVGRIVLAR